MVAQSDDRDASRRFSVELLGGTVGGIMQVRRGADTGDFVISA